MDAKEREAGVVEMLTEEQKLQKEVNEVLQRATIDYVKQRGKKKYSRSILKELRESKPIVENETNEQFASPPISPKRKRVKYVRKQLPTNSQQSTEIEPDQSLNDSV